MCSSDLAAASSTSTLAVPLTPLVPCILRACCKRQPALGDRVHQAQPTKTTRISAAQACCWWQCPSQRLPCSAAWDCLACCGAAVVPEQGVLPCRRWVLRFPGAFPLCLVEERIGRSGATLALPLLWQPLGASRDMAAATSADWRSLPRRKRPMVCPEYSGVFPARGARRRVAGFSR